MTGARRGFQERAPKFAVESRHGVSAQPTPQLFPPATAKTLLRHRVLKCFERLCVRKVLAQLHTEFRPSGPPKQQARRGADSAPRLPCFLGQLGPNPVFGAGPRPSPHLARAHPSEGRARLLASGARPESAPPPHLAARLAATVLLSPVAQLACARFPAARTFFHLSTRFSGKCAQRIPSLNHATGCRPSRPQFFPTRYGHNVFDTGYFHVLRGCAFENCSTRTFGPAGPTSEPLFSGVGWAEPPVLGAGPRPSPRLTSAPPNHCS